MGSEKSVNVHSGETHQEGQREKEEFNLTQPPHDCVRLQKLPRGNQRRTKRSTCNRRLGNIYSFSNCDRVLLVSCMRLHSWSIYGFNLCLYFNWRSTNIPQNANHIYPNCLILYLICHFTQGFLCSGHPFPTIGSAYNPSSPKNASAVPRDSLYGAFVCGTYSRWLFTCDQAIEVGLGLIIAIHVSWPSGYYMSAGPRQHWKGKSCEFLSKCGEDDGEGRETADRFKGLTQFHSAHDTQMPVPTWHSHL